MVDFLFRSFLPTGSYCHNYIHVGYEKLVGFSHLTTVLFFIGCRPLFTLNNVTMRKCPKGNNLNCVYTIPDSFLRRCRGGSRIFFRRGCTRLSLYFNTNNSFFFLQNTSCMRKPQVISGGGGCVPPAPSP